MNKRRLLEGSRIFPRTQVPAYMMCAVLFSAGVVAGTVLSSGFVESGAAEAYMSGYLPSLKEISSAGTFRYFLLLLRYPLLAFLMGFSALGAVGIPALCFARGFSLAFTLAVLTRLYAANGVLMGFMLFGVVSALALPAFLLVASGAFLSSMRLGRTWFSVPAPPDPDNGASVCFLRFFMAMLLSLLLALGERAALGSGLLSIPIFS